MDNKFSEDNDFDDVLVGVGGVSVVFLWSSLFFSLFLAAVPRHPLEKQNILYNVQRARKYQQFKQLSPMVKWLSLVPLKHTSQVRSLVGESFAQCGL